MNAITCAGVTMNNLLIVNVDSVNRATFGMLPKRVQADWSPFKLATPRRKQVFSRIYNFANVHVIAFGHRFERQPLDMPTTGQSTRRKPWLQS